MQNIKRVDKNASLGKISNANLGKNNRLNWKLDDIFLGFKDSEEGTDYENKTIKISNEQVENLESKER